MGCDGGTIPKRDELVRTKKKPEQADKDVEIAAKWKHCALSQDELKPPIVSCELGRLYNKETVIEHLLDKTQAGNFAQHIRSLKDVVELKLTSNPANSHKGARNGDSYVDHRASQFICPIVGVEMNGKYRFCYIRTCACVLSERAIKEVKSESCHKCGLTYSKDDIVVINGTNEDITDLRTKMEERRKQAKINKRAKKQKVDHHIETDQAAGSSTKTVTFDESQASKMKTNDVKGQSRGPVEAVASSSFTVDPMSKNYSVANDPSKTEAFKSLFTSHDSFKRQPKAHWVTYNPLYN